MLIDNLIDFKLNVYNICRKRVLFIFSFVFMYNFMIGFCFYCVNDSLKLYFVIMLKI